jgi:hypothetical protein
VGSRMCTDKLEAIVALSHVSLGLTALDFPTAIWSWGINR